MLLKYLQGAMQQPRVPIERKHQARHEPWTQAQLIVNLLIRPKTA
jgi:hypothetical protein